MPREVKKHVRALLQDHLNDSTESFDRCCIHCPKANLYRRAVVSTAALGESAGAACDCGEDSSVGTIAAAIISGEGDRPRLNWSRYALIASRV